MSLQLSPDQETAVRNFGEWYRGLGFTTPYYNDAPDYTQEGFAGTGKTTVLPFMIEAAGLDPMQVAFVAPTGKAAKVMTKKLRAQGMRETAVTIHKRIYRPKGMKAIQLEGEAEKLRLQRSQAVTNSERQEIDKKLHIVSRDLERAYHSDAPIFQVNPDSDIKEAQLIVVDECSMVGETVADDLRSFGVPILAIGDPGQLQPVGDKPGFLCRQPDHRLTNIHRQALDNPIIWASREIREGRMLNYGVHGDGLLNIVTRSKDEKTFDLQLDAQIIVGTNNLRWEITRKIRNLAGLGGAGPVEGEMMICVKNSQKHAELVNGTMLMVEHDTGMLKSGDTTCKLYVADEDSNAFELFGIQAYLEENYLGKGNATIPSAQLFHAKQDQRFHHLDWAYAITAHKSQGSQWGEVVVHDQSRVFKEQARQWLYTAVTRAAEKLTIVM